MLDLFSGIGGFHKGFEQAGYEFEWVGFSEIDKYARSTNLKYAYSFPVFVPFMNGRHTRSGCSRRPLGQKLPRSGAAPTWDASTT